MTWSCHTASQHLKRAPCSSWACLGAAILLHVMAARWLQQSHSLACLLSDTIRLPCESKHPLLLTWLCHHDTPLCESDMFHTLLLK